MVFKGRPSEDKLNPDVKIKKISEDETSIFDRLLVTIFEIPTEWKKVIDKLLLGWMRKGARNYLTYVEEEPVGTIALFSMMKTGGHIQRWNTERIQKTWHRNNSHGPRPPGFY